MSCRENVSYLVPRDPSIKCWSDRVKLPAPCTKNLIQLGSDEFEETMGDKIKVYLRLKPSFSLDTPYSVLSSTVLQTEAPKESVSYKNVANGVGKLIHKFTFTSILDQDVSQTDLFKKCAVKNLKKFLSGENYLLMAYGTTSAGKTYTMQGNVENPGVIPRALDFVFTALKDSIIPMCIYQPFQYNELLVLSDEQLKKDLIQKNFILSLDLTKCQRYPDASHITVQTSSSSSILDMYENMTFKEMKSNLTDTESFEMDSNSFKYSVWVSMIEIYNEQVYDLLEVPNEKGMRPKLTFRDDEYGNTFVKSLRYVNVSSGHEAFQILQFGRSNLHLAPTALNHRSSRSHCIFTITLAKFLDYDVSSHAIISRFSFCDLAGMERAKKTLNVKDRLVESKAINTSLSILVKCLTTIKENQNNKEKKMIPYRESKLTKLFRDAIMGKEQFSLIVNVTTDPNLFDETLNVLKFSAIAQKIVPQNIFAKPKITKVKKSRFSRMVVNSSYNNKIIDWDASTVADSRMKEESSVSEVEELQVLVETLREELAREKKRCEQIEVEIREELTSKFSEILKKQNENNQIRLENETERLQVMYERKEKRLVHYYEMLRKNKRQKLEVDDEMSDFEDEGDKLKELKGEVDFLRSENAGLKERIQELKAESNKFVAECSELKFKLADRDRRLEALERTTQANAVGGNALEKELRKQLDEANAKIADFKTLLDEAAADYKEVEENNKYLRNENEVLEQQLTEHRESVADLRNENMELQKLLSRKRVMIEKLEEDNEKIREELKSGKDSEKKADDVQNSIYNKELEILREQLKKTSERLNASRAEQEILKAEKMDFEKDLEISKLKIADLQSKILGMEENSSREVELEGRLSVLSEEVRRLQDFKSEAESLAREKQILEEKCNELNSEVGVLQAELKGLINSTKKENEKTLEIEKLTKENEGLQKELLHLKMKNSELQEALKEQTEDLKARERESRITLESLRAKFEAVEYQNSVMKNLKDEAEKQAYEVPQLHEEIKRLEKEIDNREKEMVTFNENRQQLFNMYGKEMTKLKEENERLRKDVLFANQMIAKNITPLKSDKAEITRLKESMKKKDEEISKLRADMNQIKRAEATSGNSDSSGRGDSPPVTAKKKKGGKRDREGLSGDESGEHLVNSYKKQVSKLKEENERLRKDILFANQTVAKNITPLKSDKVEVTRLKDAVREEEEEEEEISKLRAEVDLIKEADTWSEGNAGTSDSSSREDSVKKKKGDCTPDRLTKQVENLSLQQGCGRSTRKKVDLLQETIHPSTLKNTNRGNKKNGRKGKENGKKEEKEETEKAIESEKENMPMKKKNKCYKKLFTDNDFDGLTDLNASPLEEISRLRPRK